MTEVNIRPARSHDLPEIKAAFRKTFLEHQARQPYAFPDNWPDCIELMYFSDIFERDGQKLLESPDIFVAEVNGAFAGYVHLSSQLRSDSDWGHGSIQDIFVTPEARGQGVADALLRHVKNLAEERGWDNLSATVWTGNRYSKALFERFGFLPQSTTYRFGPNEKARDLPLPSAPRWYERWYASFWLPFALPLAFFIFFGLMAYFTR